MGQWAVVPKKAFIFVVGVSWGVRERSGQEHGEGGAGGVLSRDGLGTRFQCMRAVAASALLLKRGLTEESDSERGRKARDAYKSGPFCLSFSPATPHFPAFSEEEQEQGLMFP